MEKVKILSTETLSKAKYHLQKVTFELKMRSGTVQKQVREVYEKGSGATILLYNQSTKNIILTRQFRMPTYLNGNGTGLLIEAPAGMLDEMNPEDCIRKEVEEETGFKIQNVTKLFEAFMCPGAVTEILHFFIGEYTKEQRVSEGGGLQDEGEDIEVMELSFDEAFGMIEKGLIRDAKTIMLLQHAKCRGIF